MFAALHIPYNQTKSFSKIVLDYLDEAPALRPFYSHSPNLEGIKAAIEDRKTFPTDRHTLVDVLKQQYNSVEPSPVVQANLAALLADNTFTICTAHQPNIFTGPLYFIYKILHSIKLADSLKKDLPQYNFVPVYYMGSEDADLAELNHIYLQGKKYEWNTAQKGAVGRMVIDKALIQLIDELAGQLSVEKWGEEFIDLLRRCYRTGTTIQQATFEIVNALFGEYGLIVLIADNAALKRQMQPVFEDDLFNQRPSIIVEETCKIVSEHYNVQANPREINLFYLKDDIRERIESANSQFVIRNSQLTFTEEEMRMELEAHPERFSPNVILRGLYQETILPNIAFIGGGGELAYWLQLRDLFQAYAVPFPVLVLRNSFLIVEDKWQKRIERLGLTITDFFKTEDELMKMIVDKHSGNFISLNGNFEKAAAFFAHLQEQASAIDPTLAVHVAALKTRSFKTLQELEKKMLRAEKRKYADQQRQIQTIKSALFPDNGLQERKENI
jgi:bacillithiol biosynthesis cysteine-adding enzyme BshC